MTSRPPRRGPPDVSPARRAIEETIADGRHELDSATTGARRLTRVAATAAAVVRVGAAILAVFDERYPLGNLGHDLRGAARRLRASPGYALFAVLTLAIGIGATIAVAAVVRTVTGPPPGVHDPEAIVNVYQSPGISAQAITLSWGDFEDLRARARSFAILTAWAPTRQALAANGRSEATSGELVGGDYFDLVGVRPAMGRAIQPGDDRPGAAAVAVISDRVWRVVFDAAPDIVGRTLKLNGHAFQIVGVAPPDFQGLFNNGLVPSAVWVPLVSTPLLEPEGHASPLDPAHRDDRWLLVRGILAPGVTMAQAQAEVTGIAHALDAAWPIGRDVDPRYRQPGTADRPWVLRRSTDVVINETADGLVRPLMTLLVAAVALVLLVACTNLANLTLARGAARTRDVAVRMALGASRWRLLREPIVESAMLALAGGISGILCARVILATVGGDVAAGGLVLHAAASPGGLVLAVSAAATIVALLVAGIVPAIHGTRTDVRQAMAADAGQTTLPRWLGRRTLIALQVTVSMALLAVATVCAGEIRRQAHRDTGIAVDQLATADVDFGLQHYDPSHARAVVDTVLGLLRRQPGVVAAAASSGLPFGAETPGCMVSPASRPLVAGRSGGAFAELVSATPGIFETLNVPMVRGRSLDAAPSNGSVVVSEAVARTLFGTSDVVGRAMSFQRRRWSGMDEPPVLTKTVVGVAADTDAGSPGRRDHGTVYVPYAQQYEADLVFSVRAGDATSALSALRRTLASVDPELAVGESGPAAVVTGVSNLFLEVTAALAGMLGTFALVLALAGLYGALSHVVTRRVRELGVRVALGASRPVVLRMVLVEGLQPVLVGVAGGLVLGGLARLAVRPLFARLIPTFDPMLLAIAPVGLLLAGACACYLPARRAAAVDPNIALRDL